VAALVEALTTGRLAGAGLDVFDDEPLPVTHPLVAMDHVVLTPHVGSDTLDTFAQVFECLVDDIMRYIAGHAPHHVVNLEVLSKIPLASPSRP
jgi:phosphoglycerate dehydrogenase-like enzyme